MIWGRGWNLNRLLISGNRAVLRENTGPLPGLIFTSTSIRPPVPIKIIHFPHECLSWLGSYSLRLHQHYPLSQYLTLVQTGLEEIQSQRLWVKERLWLLLSLFSAIDIGPSPAVLAMTASSGRMFALAIHTNGYFKRLSPMCTTWGLPIPSTHK